MCGICGYISKQNITIDTLEKMTNTMIHRGPDDSGIWQAQINGTWHVGLGHRRLSILDLSEAGHQPMMSSDGRYAIVFNGEIYNFLELKDELQRDQGIVFKSDCDTEVIIWMYALYGYQCLDYLNGMFAFAIYDNLEGTLFMARDRMGEKPLYYHYKDGNIAFSSELKVLFEYPEFNSEINKDILVQYLSRNTILPPNTIFKDTFKLKAGQYLTWCDGKLKTTQYYDVMEEYRSGQDKLYVDYLTCKRELKELLIDSVDKRMISDVPFGTFLSGGIDSTLITAIANDITEGGVDSFSIGFTEKKLNEAEFANESARYLGTHHHQMIMQEEDMLSVLEDMVEYYDEPFSDSSQLPTMLVAQFAKNHVTVALSGDGGDELYAGYTSNDTLKILQKYNMPINIARTVIPKGIGDAFIGDRERILFGKKSFDGRLEYCNELREHMAKSILKDDKGSGLYHQDGIEIVKMWPQRRMLLDMMTYLPDEIMTKTDRASMRYSLEMRSPLLDYRILKHSMCTPLEYKIVDGDKKHILKEILYDYIPKEMMDRKKQGFGAPIYRWLNTVLADKLDYYSTKEYVEKQGIFDYEGLQRLLKRFYKRDENTTTSVVWGYYVLQMWWERYIGS